MNNGMMPSMFDNSQFAARFCSHLIDLIRSLQVYGRESLLIKLRPAAILSRVATVSTTFDVALIEMLTQ